jgi:hypothetical protein
MKEAKIDENLV